MPILFLLAWLISATILATLMLKTEYEFLKIPFIMFLFFILVSVLLKYLLKRYKNFSYSRLFIKNPKLSVIIFGIENLSLIVLYVGFMVLFITSRFVENENGGSGLAVFFAFILTPICVLVFAISYMFNEKR